MSNPDVPENTSPDLADAIRSIEATGESATGYNDENAEKAAGGEAADGENRDGEGPRPH